MINLRSVGQVMFQNSPLTGLLFLLGIGVACFSNNSFEVLLCAILCTAFGNLTARILKASPKFMADGLYGYNATLIGIAAAVFLEISPLMYALILSGTFVSVGVMIVLMEKLPPKLSFPALTFPFVFITWIILLIAQTFFPEIMKFSAAAPMEDILLGGLFKSFSQVFVLENTLTGIIFLIGIFLSSRIAGLYSIVGAAIAICVALLMNVDLNLIGHGLYGYNVILTAIALGAVFLKPNKQTALFVVLGIAFTLFYQELLTWAFKEHGMPILTAPFVFAVWTVLVLRHLFKKKTIS